MDDFPRSTIAVRELSHASSIAVQPTQSTSSTSNQEHDSTRHSGEAPRSNATGGRRDSEGYTSFPPPGEAGTATGGSTEEEEKRMRKRDYAVEMSRLMGRQLARGLGGNR